MEVALHLGHPTRHEAAVLADRVAAHRAHAFGNEAAKSFDEHLRRLGLIDFARAYAVDQSRTAVSRAVPLVHAVEHFFGLMNRHHGTFVQNVEVLVRDDGGHFDHAIHFGLKARHFHVDPDEVVRAVAGIAFGHSFSFSLGGGTAAGFL